MHVDCRESVLGCGPAHAHARPIAAPHPSPSERVNCRLAKKLCRTTAVQNLRNTVAPAGSFDTDFLQPVHCAIAPNGGGALQFIYIADGKTVPPSAAFGAAAGTRLLHKLDLLSTDANGSVSSTIFTMDGFMQEPRGIEIVPIDPLTGN